MKLKNKPYYEKIKDRIQAKKNATIDLVKFAAISTALIAATSGAIAGSVKLVDNYETAVDKAEMILNDTRYTHEYVDHVQSQVEMLDTQFAQGTLAEDKYTKKLKEVKSDEEVIDYLEDKDFAKSEEYKDLDKSTNINEVFATLATAGSILLGAGTALYGIGGGFGYGSEYKTASKRLQSSINYYEEIAEQKEFCKNARKKEEMEAEA